MMYEKIANPNRRDDNADMEIFSKQDKQVINENFDSL